MIPSIGQITISADRFEFAYNLKMPRKPVVAVIGTGRDSEPVISNALELGRLIATNDWVLITGGRDAGVMKAANEGAKEIKDSLTIGILPHRNAEISSAVDVAIVTDVGEARNNIIVLSADVVITCGVEGPGTASEVALALKAGKPVILVDASSSAEEFFAKLGNGSLRSVKTPGEAVLMVAEILGGK